MNYVFMQVSKGYVRVTYNTIKYLENENEYKRPLLFYLFFGKSEFIISLLGNVTNPGKGRIAIFFDNFQVTHLNTGHCVIGDFEGEAYWPGKGRSFSMLGCCD